MATKAELLEKLTKEGLKEIASENDVELEGSTKAELVEELNTSRKVTKETVEKYIEDNTESDDEEKSETAEGQTPVDASLTDASTPPNAGNTGSNQAPANNDGSAGETPNPSATFDPSADQADASGHATIVPGGAAATPMTPPHTLAQNALTAPADGPAGSGDLMLTDPQGQLREAKEGRTSDPATREEGTNLSEVPPDITDGEKRSDAGDEAYPFPPQGDVDVALLEPQYVDGEKMAPLTEGDFVVLGEHELVPDRLVGAQAAVLDAPTIICNCDWAPRTHEHVHPTAGITVRTRDEANAQLSLPLEAFKSILRGGRTVR